MSWAELISEIERLRDVLDDLVAGGADYEKVLEVSQELDKLIVEYHRTAG